MPPASSRATVARACAVGLAACRAISETAAAASATIRPHRSSAGGWPSDGGFSLSAAGTRGGLPRRADARRLRSTCGRRRDRVPAFRAAVGGDEAGLLSATSTAAGDEDDGLLDGYNRDWFGGHRGQSRCVVRPKTTEELAAVLAHCHAHRLAVVPQGGNTGLVGGSVPVFDEVIVSTSRINTIGDLDPLSGVVTLQAGVVMQELEEWLAPHGLMVPLDLGARGSCQLGGNASTAAGGARFARFGSLRSNIVGLEVVTADGTVMDMLTTMRKVRRREEKNDRQNRFHVQLVDPTDLG